MNEKLKELAEQAGFMEAWFSESGDDCEREIKKLAELIINECLAQCEEVAADARLMTQSKFVTDSGRMLHEGMWGGAKNSAGAIKRLFSINDEQSL